MKWIKRKAKIGLNSRDEGDYLQTLAKIRGIKDINEYLDPSEDCLNDAKLMKNINKANERLLDAIYSGEKIAVSVDNDGDGLTSGALFIRFIRRYTANYYMLYAQKSEGHGIEKQMDQIQDDTSLVVIIDSSSNSTDACKEINEDLGIDILIYDHHSIAQENPYVTLVNPMQKGDTYPNKSLSAAGVIFKAIELIQDELNESFEDDFDVWNHADLMAVGMRADEMDMSIPENRYLVLNGLQNIKTLGIERILKGSGIYKFDNLNSDHISFTIAPMINGAIRMGEIELPIELLLTDDDKIAKKIRLKMSKLNDLRKEQQSQAVAKYANTIDSEQKIIIVIDDESNSGFNGIVAQQLSSKYNRPALVMRKNEKGVIAGSGRSYSGFKMLSFLNQIEGVTAVGHEGAMGCEFHEDDLEYVLAYIELNMDELENKEPVFTYDIEIDVDDVEVAIPEIESFNRLYGRNAPKAFARVNGVMIDEFKTIGSTEETRKATTLHDSLELIKFKVSPAYASEVGTFDTIDVVGQLSVNKFYHGGLKETIVTNQVMIEDYRFSK